MSDQSPPTARRRRPVPPGFPRLQRWRPYGKPTARGKLFRARLLRFPHVSAGLIASFVFVYVLMMVAGYPVTAVGLAPTGYAGAYATATVMRGFGVLSRELVLAGDWWRMLAAAFLHGPPLHLLGNAFALYYLGRLVENFYGASRMVGCFVVAALAGSAPSAGFAGGPSVGASGGIMGLLGLALVYGLRERERIPRDLRDFFTHYLWFFVAAVFGIGLTLNLAIPMVDNWGHFGGLAAGLALGAVLKPVPILEDEPRQGPLGLGLVGLAGVLLVATALQAVPSVRQIPISFSDPVLGEGLQALALGEIEEAETILRNQLDSESDDPYRLLIGYDLARTQNDWDRAATFLDRTHEVDPIALQRAFGLLLRTEIAQVGEEAATGAYFANDLSWCLLRGRAWQPEEVQRGLDLVNRALEVFPDDVHFLNTRALAHYLAHDFVAALADIDRSISLRTEQHGPGADLRVDVFLRAAILFDMGQEVEARRYYRQMARRYESGELRDEAQVVISGGAWPRGGPEPESPPEPDRSGPPPGLELTPDAEWL